MSEPMFDPLYTGDTKDDDGAVIDSFFVETNNAPDRIADRAVVPTVARPVPPNRLMTGSITLNAAWEPYLMLPADTNRKSLHIRVIGTANVDFIRIADENSKLLTDTGAGRVYAVYGSEYCLDDYTGAVYISAYGSPGSPLVSWWAVTK